MALPGDTKRAFCSFCNCETTWEYVVIPLGDGYLGLQSAITPKEREISFWRCSNHTTPQGRIKEDSRKHPRPSEAAHR
jgi:hypothetical protein